MLRKKAFTLIELLVVIAIIAILAAILFPVFAQAKLAAKKTQALSNIKQVDLGIQMYINDYDDQYLAGFNPNGPGGGWSENGSSAGSSDVVDYHVMWEQNVQPYIKSIQIFYSPADANAGVAATGLSSFQGVGVSFASNGFLNGYDGGMVLHGPMGINATAGGWVGWIGAPGANGCLNAGAITQPAATVLLAEHNSDDVLKAGPCCGSVGNMSSYGPWGVIAGVAPEWGGWGPFNIPNGQATGTGFDNGTQGSVSIKYNNQGTIAFSDGHAKSMVPAATDPDPNNQPQNNMWDALR